MTILETRSERTVSECPEALGKHLFVAGSISLGVLLESVRFDVQLYCQGDFPGAIDTSADDSLSARVVVKLVKSYRGILNQKAGWD